MSLLIWLFSFLMGMCKNGNSLKLCSMVNFILGCKFWSKLCKCLILPHYKKKYRGIEKRPPRIRKKVCLKTVIWFQVTNDDP